jgi:hypothetical protein
MRMTSRIKVCAMGDAVKNVAILRRQSPKSGAIGSARQMDVGGAENWACLASLVETCKLHAVDPQAYLADVLTKLVNLWPESRLDELMPWAWAASRTTNRLAA